jgi:hypothetical protein
VELENKADFKVDSLLEAAHLISQS